MGGLCNRFNIMIHSNRIDTYLFTLSFVFIVDSGDLENVALVSLKMSPVFFLAGGGSSTRVIDLINPLSFSLRYMKTIG